MQMMFIELPTSKIVFKNTMKPGNKAVSRFQHAFKTLPETQAVSQISCTL